MDIIELLVQDHHEVNALFGRFKQSSKPETQSELAKEIVRELSIHAAIEEQFVYPMVRRKVDDGDGLADHAIDEHQEVKNLLSDIEKLNPDQAEFGKTMEQVISSVTEHVEEEEGELLPKLRDTTTAESREKVGSLAEKAKSLVPTHPHPLVPGTATAQLLAGPWAGMADRLRDLLAG
jgi:hemerythrin superfamily protein